MAQWNIPRNVSADSLEWRNHECSRLRIRCSHCGTRQTWTVEAIADAIVNAVGRVVIDCIACDEPIPVSSVADAGECACDEPREEV